MEKPPKAEELAKKDDKGLPHCASRDNLTVDSAYHLGRSIQSSYH
jgi:hypothetical protein